MLLTFSVSCCKIFCITGDPEGALFSNVDSKPINLCKPLYKWFADSFNT